MMTPTILRVGALAAIFSLIAQVTSVALAPDWSGPPDVGAASVVRAADIWMAWSLIKLVGILLTVPALTIMLRTLEGTEGGEWARVCLPLAIVAVAQDLADLRGRLGAITVGQTFDIQIDGRAVEFLIWKVNGIDFIFGIASARNE